MGRIKSNNAFTVIETLVVIATIAVLVSTLLPALGEARNASKLAISLSNLRQFAVAGATYAGDFDDRIYAFTSAPNSEYVDLRALAYSGTPLRQAVGQAIDIIRRRTGRDRFPIPSNWIPNVLYTHLVLNDYLAQRLPDKMVVSPADKHRSKWQKNPQKLHDEGAWQPYQNPEAGHVPGIYFRWPYSSSYQVVPATYDQNQSRWNGNLSRISQGNHNTYHVPNVPMGNLRMASVSFPGSKVQVMDSEGRHSGRVYRYHAHEDAKVVMHFFDGAASFLPTSEANEGWKPNDPSNRRPSEYAYQPRSWEAPKSDPTRHIDRVKGYYRWTRGGLKGVDFGADEINTGQKH